MILYYVSLLIIFLEARYRLYVVVFPQAPFRVTNVPGQASAGIEFREHSYTVFFGKLQLSSLKDKKVGKTVQSARCAVRSVHAPKLQINTV